MDWTIELNKHAHFIRVTTHGDFEIKDCVEIKKDFLSRDYWHPGMNVLLDYRHAAFNSTLTLDALREIGDFHKSRNEQIGSGKMAFLMKSPRDFGFARQYEMINEDKVFSHIHVFLDESEALEWLTTSSMAV